MKTLSRGEESRRLASSLRARRTPRQEVMEGRGKEIWRWRSSPEGSPNTDPEDAVVRYVATSLAATPLAACRLCAPTVEPLFWLVGAICTTANAPTLGRICLSVGVSAAGGAPALLRPMAATALRTHWEMPTQMLNSIAKVPGVPLSLDRSLACLII